MPPAGGESIHNWLVTNLHNFHDFQKKIILQDFPPSCRLGPWQKSHCKDFLHFRILNHFDWIQGLCWSVESHLNFFAQGGKIREKILVKANFDNLNQLFWNIFFDKQSKSRKKCFWTIRLLGFFYFFIWQRLWSSHVIVLAKPLMDPHMNVWQNDFGANFMSKLEPLVFDATYLWICSLGENQFQNKYSHKFWQKWKITFIRCENIFQDLWGYSFSFLKCIFKQQIFLLN